MLRQPTLHVFDADFSTTQDRIEPVDLLHEKFTYSQLVPDEDEDHQRFKADISVRGLLLPGIEKPLLVPYDLGHAQDLPGDVRAVPKP